MTDFLVQRLSSLSPSDKRAWVDEEIVRDLTADQAEKAVKQAAAKNPDDATTRRRATKWDHVEEFDLSLGEPVASKATKGIE